MSDNINPDDFSIKEENEEDFRQSVIARSNLTNEFTIHDVESHKKKLDSMEHELEAQVRVTKGVLDNVERNHEFVTSLTDEEIAIVAYYNENREVLKQSEEKLEQVKEGLEAYQAVLDTVYDKFGFVRSEEVIDDESEGDTGE